MLSTWGCVGMGSVWGCLVVQALWRAGLSLRAGLALCGASVIMVAVASEGSGSGWRGALATGASAAVAAMCLSLVFHRIARRHARGPSRG
jgi:hypothetical protein